MRPIAFVGVLLLAAGCSPADEQDAPQTEPQEAEAPAAMSLADFAGTWSMRATDAAGENVLIEYEMEATDGMDGWSVTFPDREPIPAQILEAAGDSVVIHLGPYASALREDVNVTTVTVARIVDGQMVGYFTATYDTEGPDNILHGIQLGERSH
ncbi:hypothetical protein ACFL3S_07890 [Gemmatimonadota bacterium]